jgi:ferredoxin
MVEVSRRRRLLPDISARCTGCGRCVAACDPHVLWLEPHGWEKSAVLHDPEGCTGCSRCAVVCPFDAITMHRLPRR